MRKSGFDGGAILKHIALNVADAEEGRASVAVGRKSGALKRRVAGYEHKGRHRLNNSIGWIGDARDRPADACEKAHTRMTCILICNCELAGMAERSSMSPPVSLHVHERIEPRTIIVGVHRRNGDSHGAGASSGAANCGVFRYLLGQHRMLKRRENAV